MIDNNSMTHLASKIGHNGCHLLSQSAGDINLVVQRLNPWHLKSRMVRALFEVIARQYALQSDMIAVNRNVHVSELPIAGVLQRDKHILGNLVFVPGRMRQSS
jgi:hypothetical protein